MLTTAYKLINKCYNSRMSYCRHLMLKSIWGCGKKPVESLLSIIPHQKIVHITQTCLCNILRFFTAEKYDNFQMKKIEIFFFCSKHRLLVHVRTALMRRF